MLPSETLEQVLSKRQITDSGLGEKLELSPSRHQIIDRMSEEYEVMKSCITRLKRLGVTAVERPIGHPLDVEEPYEFQADTNRVERICLYAFTIGSSLERIRQMFWGECMVSLKEQYHEEAGKAGGLAVSAAAQERRKDILDEYKIWAGTEDNGKSVPAFAKQLAEKKKRKKLRGFSQKTIERIVHEFHNDICRVLQSNSLPTRDAHKRIALIAELMKDQSGVSTETVRRALA